MYDFINNYNIDDVHSLLICMNNDNCVVAMDTSYNHN